MSLSSTHLRAALRRPTGVVVLPPGFKFERLSRSGCRDLEELLRDGQNRFKAPHLRDHGYRLPMPFRWGPNGGLMLLGAMLAGYALLVIAILVVRGFA